MKHIKLADNAPTFAGFQINLEDLKESAIRIAENASNEWKSAHFKLLAEIRTTYQQAINIVLGKLRSKLGNPLNGWKFDCAKRPGQVTIDAENELLRLRQRSLVYQASIRQNLDSKPAELEYPDPKTSRDWLTFIAILAVLIVLEALANVTLLAPALSTGLIGAFVTALLVSAINVAALGAGSGLAVSRLRYKSTGRRWIGPVCGLWGLLAVGLNLLVGRHREAFARTIDQRELQVSQASEADMIALIQGIAADTPFNPFTWKLESLLFFLLGVALCAFGFYKGFTFMKPRLRRSEEKTRLASERSQIEDEYHGLSQRYRKILTDEIRPSVAGWVEELSVDCLEAKNGFEDLEHDWSEGISMHYILSQFVIAYNMNHVDKIDLEMLEVHRGSQQVDLSFPATPADRKVLSSADELLSAWTDSGQEEFFATIVDETQRIDDLWKNYASVVCGPLDVKPAN